jgi:hypothetical protein
MPKSNKLLDLTTQSLSPIPRQAHDEGEGIRKKSPLHPLAGGEGEGEGGISNKNFSEVSL